MCKDVDPQHVLEVASQSLEVLSIKYTKVKKENRRLDNELACLKHELNEMTIKFMEMKDVANKTDNSFMNLTTENNDALILISELESKISSLENTLRKGKEISNPFESKMLEIKVLELDDANEKVSTLEMKVSNLVDSLKEKEQVISFKNTDNRLLSQKIEIYEAKTERLEKNISNLKAEGGKSTNVASTSFGCQTEIDINDRTKTLELSNSKLRDIIKKFTASHFDFNILMNNLGNNANRHGLGFDSNAKSVKPKKTNSKSFACSSRYPLSYWDDDSEYVKTHAKSTCHHCNKLGHVSFDCFARYNPKKFFWVVKQQTNNVGSKDWIPKVTSCFAGVPSSST